MVNLEMYTRALSRSIYAYDNKRDTQPIHKDGIIPHKQPGYTSEMASTVNVRYNLHLLHS